MAVRSQSAGRDRLPDAGARSQRQWHRTLRDVIGQRRMLGRLGEKALEGDVAHAYELSGPRSIGKRTVAIRFAQTLLCTSEPLGAGGCGHCLACRKIDHYTHPDVRLVTRLVDVERET